jgi:hypothetical protein
VSIDSDGGRAEVTVRAVPLKTTLRVEPLELNFGVLPASGKWKRRLRLSNPGLGALQGRLRSDQAWLLISPASFSNDAEISVSVNAAQLARAQSYQGQVLIESNGGVFTVPLSVTISSESPIRYRLRHLIHDYWWVIILSVIGCMLFLLLAALVALTQPGGF